MTRRRDLLRRSRGAAGAVCLACGLILLLRPARASAQPAGLSNQAPASAGKTEVAKEGFQAAAPGLAPDSKDGTTFKLTAGGFLSLGNSRTVALTGVADYFLRRGPSQFSALAAANYGRSTPNADARSEVTVQNYQAWARYDYFFSGGLAGFGALSARRDRFLHLDLRLNIAPGLAYYFIDEKEERFWVELGYDLQLDLRQQSLVDASRSSDMVSDVKRSEARHNGRLFTGYVHQIAEAVKFSAGIEYLQNVQEAKNARLNVDLGVTSQLNTSFSIATTLSIRFDNNPLPGVETTDVVSALNLVYTLAQ